MGITKEKTRNKGLTINSGRSKSTEINLKLAYVI